MNKAMQSLNIEKILFMDIEVVRKTKELDINSREFELYQKKIRNKETDELLPSDEVIEDYKKRAALKMGYTTIVSIGVGFVKDGEVHIKALDEGSEEDIIKQFCTISQSFDYICGMNIIGYDLPMLIVNGFRYFNVVEVLPDRFVTSGKKPWELKSIIDLMDQFRGTHYANCSLDEILYHFGLNSSKTELDGSKVSDEYWDNGVDKISEYVKQDVFANVNVFRKMRFEEIFENFKDKNSFKVEKLPLLERLYQNNYLSDEIKVEIQGLTKKKKITVKDKKNLKDILESSYIRSTFMANDDKATVERKQKEIEEFLKTLT